MVTSTSGQWEMRARRIAVADDEPELLEFYELMLPRLGYEVVGVAANGHELVELCRIVLPDLILTDVDMPGMDGLRAVDEICSVRPLPVVVISGHPVDGLPASRLGKHGIVYLCKPVRTEHLKSAIQLACQRFAEQNPAISAAY